MVWDIQKNLFRYINNLKIKHIVHIPFQIDYFLEGDSHIKHLPSLQSINLNHNFFSILNPVSTTLEIESRSPSKISTNLNSVGR